MAANETACYIIYSITNGIPSARVSFCYGNMGIFGAYLDIVKRNDEVITTITAR